MGIYSQGKIKQMRKAIRSPVGGSDAANMEGKVSYEKTCEKQRELGGLDRLGA